ncbi:hypothetical protein [Verminephrobacter eiseniae]|uniref:hypothetical protein n=1 Tax=Verminephrobacter eiseniae TaxID=364317 RepID=UPI0002FBA065|nr:hypothetical protein [Verminephrobacter eiseniae]
MRDLLEIPDLCTVALRDPRGLPMAGISVSTIAPHPMALSLGGGPETDRHGLKALRRRK